jgi:hypothetical protein
MSVRQPDGRHFQLRAERVRKLDDTEINKLMMQLAQTLKGDEKGSDKPVAGPTDGC